MGASEGVAIESKNGNCDEHGPFESRPIAALGRIFSWSKCPECSRIAHEKAKVDAARYAAEAAAIARQKKIEWAGIPIRFRSRSFENFEANTSAKRECLDAAVGYVESFLERKQEGATMVLSGMPGTGKSHLATAMCMALIDQGWSVRYLNALDAIRAIRGTWKRDAEKSEAQIMSELAGVDLLVIDEVGAQYGTEGEQIIMFDIINRRYQDMAPMVLLTNQGKDGFRQYLGDRAFDRLREGGKWLAFDWDSYRGRAVG